MSRKSILLPSLLSAPFHRLGEAIQDLEDVGVRLLHYDVMDGHFVPNLTYGPILIKGLENHIQSQFDVHLMVTNPEVMIKWFDLPNVRSITIHIEVSHDIQRDIQDIRKRGKKVGISMN
ncbi:ribulose-phosphate 3-epimerase, partial [bacterium]|nr:ribulose-phosphate 3-epimerase [bacterium]